MKQILIRHTDDVSEEEALHHAYGAIAYCSQRTGVLCFKDGITVIFSDRSKYPSMVVIREE